MKKLFLALSVALSLFFVSAADELSKEQMALRLEIIKYLTAEGYAPKIDKDGDVKFTKDDRLYYTIINPDWKEPYMVTLYIQYAYSNADDDVKYTRKNVEGCISAVSKKKTVKLFCQDQSYSLRTDLFLKDANLFKSSFPAIMEEFESARKEIVNLVSLGLPDIDYVGNKDEVFDKAMSYYRADDYSKSYPIFKMLSDDGYVQAYGYMGLAYELGEGVSRNEDLMIKYYQMAIENGSPWCAYRLGDYYYKMKSYVKASGYYNTCGASNNGFQSEALFKLGTMYESGEGVSQSRAQAINYYKKSVACSTSLDCDARRALLRLGERYEMKEDFVDATKSMLYGLSPSGMFDKGFNYEYGGNYNVNLPKAYAYYKASADAGFEKALDKMGEIYISDYYPFHDKAKSDKYYQKLIKIYKQRENSDHEACCELGYLYHNGRGVICSIDQAKVYYKKATLMGNMNAPWRLGLIYKDESEYNEAFVCFLNAAEKGQGMAMYELAKLYEDGIGTSMNKSKAIEWYKKCAKSNYSASSEARSALDRLGIVEEKE